MPNMIESRNLTIRALAIMHPDIFAPLKNNVRKNKTACHVCLSDVHDGQYYVPSDTGAVCFPCIKRELADALKAFGAETGIEPPVGDNEVLGVLDALDVGLETWGEDYEML